MNNAPLSEIIEDENEAIGTGEGNNSRTGVPQEIIGEGDVWKMERPKRDDLPA